MSDATDLNNSVTEQVKGKVHYELVDILYKQIKQMLWAEAFAATLILFVLWWYGNGDRMLVLGWYAFMLVISWLPRYLLTRAYTRLQLEHQQVKGWEMAIMVMLFISALGWSFVGTVLLPQNSGLYQALVIFLLVGVAATANPFYSPIKKAYAIFLIPTLAFTAIFLLLKGSNFYIFSGIAVFAFGLLMLITSIVSSSLITTALTVRFQNIALTEDLVKLNKKLENLATHDVLTQLPNRQFFNEKIFRVVSHAKEKNKHFALMFLDIDKFKMINDTLGHAAGDQLLVVVADRLAQCVHSAGIVCRLGGDEFMVLLENVLDKEAISRIAKSICQSLAEPVKIKNNNIFVTTSIGISFYPEDGLDEETLTKHSDMAMYDVKNNGGNSFKYYSDSKIS